MNRFQMKSIFALATCWIFTACDTPFKDANRDLDYDGSMDLCSTLKDKHCAVNVDAIKVSKDANNIYMTWKVYRSEKNRTFSLKKCTITNKNEKNLPPLTCTVADFNASPTAGDKTLQYTNEVTFSKPLPVGEYDIQLDFSGSPGIYVIHYLKVE